MLTAGRVFARDAAGLNSKFAGHGMPETFLADLDDLVATFEEATRYRTAGRNDQTAARAGIEAALASGMEAVRKLDVIIANRLHDDAVTRAVWERERRVGYPKTAEPAVPSVVPPTAPVN